ncbi:MAG: zinc ribbon domain-containing protein [Azoarcus sp.]|jgi:putative FmdB family regulatory protein|nr:zinc ribbon domain-containing protein [Azoarcus sp.]
MPIYEYRCEDCGFQKEHLQKMRDDALTVCPACGGHYVRQISAAGFQLKGSGWYATDFKGGNKPGKTDKAPAASETPPPCGAGCACCQPS